MSLTLKHRKGMFIFGDVPLKPIRGLKKGRARIRMRQGSFAEVWLRTKGGITHYLLKEKGTHWTAIRRPDKNQTIQ